MFVHFYLFCLYMIGYFAHRTATTLQRITLFFCFISFSLVSFPFLYIGSMTGSCKLAQFSQFSLLLPISHLCHFVHQIISSSSIFSSQIFFKTNIAVICYHSSSFYIYLNLQTITLMLSRIYHTSIHKFNNRFNIFLTILDFPLLLHYNLDISLAFVLY